MQLLTLALLSTLAVGQVPAAEFYEDFRGKKLSELKVTPNYPGAEAFMKSEPEGLRITLPARGPKHLETGVVAPVTIKGDFEITAGYDIVEIAPHNAGWGISFELFVITNAREDLGFQRIMRTDGSGIYFFNRFTLRDGKRQKVMNSGKVPVKARQGRMRITRVGSEAILSAAELASDDFQEVFRVQLGSEDIMRCRTNFQPRGASSLIDARLLDLHVKGSLTAADPGGFVEVVPSAPVQRKALWWLAGLFAAALLIGVVILWWRKARAPANEQ